MNKKIFAATVALGSLVFVGGTQANAETTQRNMETKTGISFYEGSIPNPGPFAGQLSLAYVPGSFDFGANEITQAGAYAKSYAQQNTTAKKYIAVSDDRKSDKKDWQLQAKLAEFVSADGSTNLVDAVLSFDNGALQAYGMNTAQSDLNKTPTPAITEASALTALNEDVAKTFNSASKISLTAGSSSATNVLTYKAPQTPTADAVIVASEVTNAQLKVLNHSNVSNKAFSSKISWTLTDDVKP